MDLVNLLFLAGACDDSMTALRGKSPKQAWSCAGSSWREFALNSGSGDRGGSYGHAVGAGAGAGDGDGAGYGASITENNDTEICHDGAWRGRTWARGELSRLAGEMSR